MGTEGGGEIERERGKEGEIKEDNNGTATEQFSLWRVSSWKRRVQGMAEWQTQRQRERARERGERAGDGGKGGVSVCVSVCVCVCVCARCIYTQSCLCLVWCMVC